MYFHELGDDADHHFVLQDTTNGSYLEHAPLFNTEHVTQHGDQHYFQIITSLRFGHAPVWSKAKKYKRKQDLLMNIRNSVRNQSPNCFFPTHSRTLALRDYNFESMYWFGNESPFIHASDKPDFSCLQQLDVVHYQKSTKTKTVMPHDLPAFAHHCFYKARSNRYFGHAVTEFLCTHELSTFDPNTVFLIGIVQQGDSYEIGDNSPYLIKKSQLVESLKKAGLSKKDYTLVFDSYQYIVAILPEHQATLTQHLNNHSYDVMVHSVGDFLNQQEEIDLNALHYKLPNTP